MLRLTFVVLLTLSLSWFCASEPLVSSETLLDIYKKYNENPGFDHYYQYGPAYEENMGHLRRDAAKNKLSLSKVLLLL